MKTISAKKIRKTMEKNQTPKRYEHTLGVTYTATALAMRYGANIRQAELAGLLHDCAKCISFSKCLHICEKHNIPISEIERKNPALLHAKAGSFIAMKEFGIYDHEVINAILNHTTGRPNMSLLEKIIFVADYIEPNRKILPELTMIREQAFVDLDEALCMILKNILEYLKKSECEIDMATQKTYDFYIEERKEKKV